MRLKWMGLRLLAVVWVAGITLFGTGAVAQQAWVQIEARPTLAQAQERAAFFAGALDNVNGYTLPTGWHAIALGPFALLEAEAELRRLRGVGAIPRDAFISDGSAFRSQFWPPAGAASGSIEVTAIAPADAAPAPVPLPAEETVAQSRAAERGLTRQEREEVQRALAWDGTYDGAIDGDFGAGTRRAMAVWQAAANFERTGVLTTRQRSNLVTAYRDAQASLGLRTVADRDAGIEFVLPSQIMEFARYDPPFAQYEATDGSDARLLLISQAGDRNSLASLYEVLQTLEIVPPDGPRRLGRDTFSIRGTNGKIVSNSFATRTEDGIKGYTLVWPAQDAKRGQLVLGALQAAFAPISGTVLPDAALGDGMGQDPDLLAGLRIRTPERAMSGFFVDTAGRVLTTNAAIEGCGRIELGDGALMQVAAEDAELGVALLQPAVPLRPLAVPSLRTGAPRLQSEIAVAGYSYGGRLGAASVTFGTLTAVRGLDGDAGSRRLDLAALPGDAGGPVFDQAGQVIGLLQPNPEHDQRILPEGVAIAAGSDALAAFLAEAGITGAAAAPKADRMPPEDLALFAQDVTVLVTCWAQ